MASEKIIEEIESLLFTEAEFGALFDIQIDYLKESVRLDVLSTSRKQIKKTILLFEQVLSLYVCKSEDAEGFRLNELNDIDEALLSEISYHPYGFGKINVETINAKIKGIEKITSKTNFYFQVNNKDYFFLEANRLVINHKVFNNLLMFKKDT
ncbi:hypothetical protein ACIQ1H_19065 [Lysinibacillus sp. NPDC097279]|uniref:YxiG family protein n=1 Tax=Lysinibacillus sp. NPDC097279 TaxID=3364143 RepID=UPI003815EE09